VQGNGCPQEETFMVKTTPDDGKKNRSRKEVVTEPDINKMTDYQRKKILAAIATQGRGRPDRWTKSDRQAREAQTSMPA